MTEAEWLACTDPTPMLEALRGKASGRKTRLLGCAFCRMVWDHLVHPNSRRSVEVAEAYADDQAPVKQLRAALRRGEKAAQDPEPPEGLPAEMFVLAIPTAAATVAREHFDTDHVATIAHLLRDDEDENDYGVSISRDTTAIEAKGQKGWADLKEETRRRGLRQANLVRDIFGNPFRPVTFDPSWRTSTAVVLARTVYADRAFDRLPILADALEDAGCDDADLLSHCRGDGPHVRGCWAVDLILGKS